MQAIKVKIIFGLLLSFFFGIEMKGMLRSQGLSEPARRVRDRALSLSKGKRAEYIKNIIPKSAIFQQKKPFILPRFVYVQPLSKKEIDENFKIIKLQLSDNQVFVYQQGTTEGAIIDKELATLSTMLVNSIDVRDSSNKFIALDFDIKFSGETIRYVFNEIFQNFYNESQRLNTPIDKVIIEKPTKYSFQELVDINNLLSYLDPVAPNIQRVYLSPIKDIIDQSPLKLCHNQDFDLLNSDLQKTILLGAPIISFLKGLMMRYNIAHTQEAISKSVWPSFAQLTSVSFDSNSEYIFSSFNAVESKYKNAVFFFNTKTRYKKIEWSDLKFVNYAQSNDNAKMLLATEYTLNVIDASTENIIVNRQFQNSIKKAIFSPDNLKVLIILKQHPNPIQLIDINAGTISFFPNYNLPPLDAIFSPDSQHLVAHFVGNTQSEIKLLGVNQQTFINDIYQSSDRFVFPSLTNDGTRVFCSLNSYNIIKEKNTGYFKDLESILVSDITNINDIRNTNIILDKELKASWLLLTPNNDIIAFSREGEIFFISINEDNVITNTILIRPINLNGAIKTLNDLAISPNGKKIAGGGIDHSTAKENYLYTWTLLTDEDEKILKSLSLKLLGEKNITIDHLKLIYQLWLVNHKGIEPSQYPMDPTEKAIYQSLPEAIKKLVQ